MIPKNIHLIFLRKDEPFPELFEKCKQEIQVNHPDWNIRLYNKDDAQDILNQDLKVMDSTATSLCRDNQIPLMVFEIAKPENIVKIVKGEHIGTIVK